MRTQRKGTSRGGQEERDPQAAKEEGVGYEEAEAGAVEGEGTRAETEVIMTP